MQYITEGIKNPNEDVELLGFGDADSEERLSDISDSVLSMGTETDSINSIVEYTLFPETAKPPVESIVRLGMPTNLPRPPQKQIQAGSSRLSLSKSSSKISSTNLFPLSSSSYSAIFSLKTCHIVFLPPFPYPGSKKTVVSSSSAVKGSKRWV
ncbi:kinesin-like protein KIN-14J [Forsythia ovata]|uniref:Kinesin-like protein KIN-14J n=1 Tax=Forsythia ovata TaxID=205694 RepID=A0ABD1W218_9LAMI